MELVLGSAGSNRIRSAFCRPSSASSTTGSTPARRWTRRACTSRTAWSTPSPACRSRSSATARGRRFPLAESLLRRSAGRAARPGHRRGHGRGRSSARRRRGGGVRTAATGLAGACATAAAVAACGTPSPDLFVVHRSGDVPGAKLDLLVSDTSVRCNGKRHPLSSDQIIEARALTDDLLETQRDPVRPRGLAGAHLLVLRALGGGNPPLRRHDARSRPGPGRPLHPHHRPGRLRPGALSHSPRPAPRSPRAWRIAWSGSCARASGCSWLPWPLLWGASYLFIKVALDGGIDPLVIVFSRLVLGAPCSCRSRCG